MGWILTVLLVVLGILAIVDPGRGVIGGLIAIVVVWAVALGMNFPSGRVRGTFDGDIDRTGSGQRDFGRDAADLYEHERQSD